jgi:protein-tyrosine-phosphatase
MAEIGIDISKQNSKSIEEFRGKDIDIVVSVCKSTVKITCALCSSSIISDRPQIIEENLPGAKRYLHCPFSDPSEVEGSDVKKRARANRLAKGFREKT